MLGVAHRIAGEAEASSELGIVGDVIPPSPMRPGSGRIETERRDVAPDPTTGSPRAPQRLGAILDQSKPSTAAQPVNASRSAGKPYSDRDHARVLGPMARSTAADQWSASAASTSTRTDWHRSFRSPQQSRRPCAYRNNLVAMTIPRTRKAR